MSLRPDEITIAVTVFDRREYLRQSIGSALAQTVPVRVMVVEDCGPDSELEAYVRREFDARVEYFRSPQRRGIFGNWNACIEQCKTKWLSILHDDDWLQPHFVEAIIELEQRAGERGLYFGQTLVVDDAGQPKPAWAKPPLPAGWRPICFDDVMSAAPFSYPGQLFQVAAARQLGGFRETSLFCGDWEFWSKLIAQRQGAETGRTVAVFRDHSSWERGTNRIYRAGKPFGLAHVQRKRNFALARRLGGQGRFDRRAELRRSCLPTRYLLSFASYFSPRYLAYNAGLLLLSEPPHASYRLLQILTKISGPRVLAVASRVWRRWHGLPGAAG